MKKAVLVAASAVIFAAPLVAAGGDVHVVTPAKIKWGANPSLPKGAKYAVMYGDPSKPGPFVVRVKFPANTRYPAHTHPDDRTVTVLSGTLYPGEGEKLDSKKVAPAPVGSIIVEPAKTPHFLITKGEVVIQATGTGPSGTDYVNPADDPRKKP